MEALIKGVHRQLDSYPWADLTILGKDLQLQYNNVLDQEDMLWYQKSSEKWVKFGNKNTKFFHTQTVIRRRRNRITGLNIDGIWCTNEEVLKTEAQNFFKNLFQSCHPCQPTSLPLRFIPKLDNNIYDSLIKLVEVQNAIHAMGSYKAPGPDGF